MPRHPTPDFSRETYWHTHQPDWAVIGLDEAGRGPWAGPVVAGAAWVNPNAYGRLHQSIQGIHDSKTLSPDKRLALYRQLIASREVETATGMVSAEDIDRLGIIAATTLAMRMAHANLTLPPAVASMGRVFLVDGPLALSVADPDAANTRIEAQTKGDGRIVSIAIASIIAKVVRDKVMGDLAQTYPSYHWATNKGYGTAQHRHALHQHGVTAHHRKSFRPVAELVGVSH